ncbi:hypothetical protein DSO57_1028611 [Entomophthora muscae]|uniref:Uncharacterized protein n=1 Tax=Entomophthora muscae TaxID=34485 RepID=A0ACC2T1W4_9FUNG|nr:hypothetical protein DSO57_1028611 [Entomophthora muscae]
MLDLWSKISSYEQLVGDNPSSLLNLPSSLLFSGEIIVKSLTCNNLDFEFFDYALPNPMGEEMLTSSLPSLEKSNLVPLQVPVMPPLTPIRMPWLLTSLILMGFNTYFPQLSPVSSLWSPLQAAVPVLHWAASWWFVFLGWEPNLVSLAPLSFMGIQQQLIWWGCKSVYPSQGQGVLDHMVQQVVF